MGSDRVRAKRKSSSTLTPGFKPNQFSFLQPRYQDTVETETDSFQGNKQQNSSEQSNPTLPFLGHSFGRTSVLPIQMKRTSVLPIQMKLAIRQPNDKYEQEAARVAEQVMQMPEPESPTAEITRPVKPPVVQRVCSECEEELQRQPMEEEEEEEETLQTKPLASQITPLVQAQVVSPEEQEEEILQTKLLTAQMRSPVQRQIKPIEEEEEDETLQAKALSRKALQEFSLGGEATVQREAVKEDEEKVQTKPVIHQGSTLVQQQFEAGEVNVTENRTGIPNSLKIGLEELSGMDLSGIRVHGNSSKPAQINALAYTQGLDIHVAPGQEKHLPHEGWHVVQQMQGRVQPTMQAKGVSINDDKKLEREADVMGAKALRMTSEAPESTSLVQRSNMKTKSQSSWRKSMDSG